MNRHMNQKKSPPGKENSNRISPTTTGGKSSSISPRSSPTFDQNKPLKPIAVKSAIPHKVADIVTGRELRAVYFDPKSCGEKIPIDNEEWLGANLFVPAAVLKQDDATYLLTLKLPSGEIYKVNSRSAYEVPYRLITHFVSTYSALHLLVLPHSTHRYVNKMMREWTIF
jgi:hypothetical protein